MGNVISVIDALAEEKTGGENIEPKVMTADLAQSLYAGDFRVPVNANMPRTGAFTNFMYGLIDTADTFFNDTPEQVRLLGGQSQVVLGGLKNDKELIKRGQMNLQTATRNLQYNQQQRDMLTPESAQESFGYTLGSGVTNYGTMVLGGYGAGAGVKALTGSAKLSGKVAGAASIGTMGVMETGGEAQERAQKYTADTQDTSFKNYAPEQGLKNIAAEAGYGTVSMIMEKYLGYGEQRRMFSLDLAKLRNPKLRATASLTKTGVKAGVSEAETEFAQSLANIGIDLIDGTMDWEQVPDRLKLELNGWAAAAVIGGTAGVGAGIYNRSRGIKIIKEELRGAVPEEDLERTAAAVFDSAAQKVSDVVSVELELFSELQTKHGAVMDSMQRAIKQAVDESGAFTDVSEEELTQYIGDTSKLFADQVLAEATQRNVPIEEVIKASDIVYENGEIRLKNKEEKPSVSQEKLYQLPQGRKVYSVFDLKVGDHTSIGDVQEIDNENKTIKINDKLYSMMLLDTQIQYKGLSIIDKSDTQNNIDNTAEENIKKASENRSEVEKQKLYNTEYNKKAKDYFGTTRNLNEAGYILTDGFLLDLSGKNQGGRGGYRALDHLDVAEALENADMYDFINSGNIRYLPESDTIQIADIPTAAQYQTLSSIINKAGGEVTVQLISDAHNDSFSDYYREYEDLTLSKLKKDINAFYKGAGVQEITQYYQRAFAGSRVDYDRPSLEAIGTGEGNQAHGWGLYYALNKDVAERYRKKFIKNIKDIELEGKVYKSNTAEAFAYFDYILSNKDIVSLLDSYRLLRQIYKEDTGWGNELSELNKKEKFIKENKDKLDHIKEIKYKGQVHEVDIPENPYLLDEQKPFSEQSEFVKDAIRKLNNEAVNDILDDDITGEDIYGELVNDVSKNIDADDLRTKTNMAQKVASQLLEKVGIKGITYNGKQDGRAFVIFNPDDVQVIQKFYQKGIAKNAVKITGKEFGEYDGDDKAYIAKAREWYRKNLTGNPAISPVLGEVNFYNRQFGETKDKNIKNIENLKYLPAVRQIIETSSSVQEEKPNHFRRDDVVQFYRITAPVDINGEVNSVSVLIAEDIQGRKYYTLENKGLAQDTSVERGLAQAQKGNSFYDLNIYVNKENVKTNNTSTNLNPKGLYDASKGIIRVFETADFSTLPHEMAHYWLDNMWSYVRSGNASEKYRQRWNVIANWLNVRPEQAILTRGQQEKFARGYEQYLLNGNLPIPIIKGAFDDYDRWLKRVYGDMNRLNIRLSEDAVRFFQSMTTGVLPPPQIKPARKPRGKMTRAEKLREQLGLREQDKQEQEAVKFVEEMEAARPLPDSVDERTVIVSNITEGEPGKSRVYSREVERNIDTLQEIADIDLEYNKIKLEEQAQRAAEYVKNNLEDARKIIDGRKAAPENILDTAIRIAYEQEMLRIGDNAEYLRALKLHSSLQTLRGQEIVAERISTKDIASPTYWINKLVAHRTYKAASKIFKGYMEAVGGDSPLDSYKKMIKEETAKITKKVLAETTREGQQRVLESELKRLRYEYGTGEQGELFQMPIEPLNARNAKMYIREALDGVFGTTVTQEEANQIIGKIGEIEKSIVNTLDETGNPSVQTWQKINEMNNLVEGLTPSPALQIFSSIIARGAMLASIKSPVLNVISNTENILTEILIRRAVNSLEGGASFSAVDKSVEKDYLAYADDVYRASGYNVSTTEGLDAATITLGERRISTQGAGKFRAFARGVETGVFKYMMGYPDSRAKDFVFSDAAALEATTIAQNEGLSGEALSKRATELYEDATRVAPLTEEGMVIREKAMMEANVATYTNDTAFSKFALGIRETLNRATGNVRLGDQLMPFVKTPANVVALGVEYSIGAAYLIPNLTTVIRDVKAGKLSAKSRMAIKAAVRNGLGVVLAMLIAMALDPDDYTPDYDALTMSERRLALEKNAVFNSIRIGDKYISLDYFGPLAIPLTAVLSARRREETGWFGYAKGVASQLQKLPGLKEYSEAVDAVGRAVSNTPEKTIKNLNNAMIDFIRARTIPSIVNDLAKSIDTYERETSAGTYDKAQASVPGIREELPLKYTTTSRTPKETEAALSILLFGARVKTAASNRVIYEIDRLYKKNAKPTITDVTRSGKLSELSEAKQQRVRKEFAKRYYDGVYTLIRTREYRAKDDEQRAAAINKVRRQIIEQLKKEYIK